MVDKQFIISELPDPGTQAWEDMADSMREDIDMWQKQHEDRRAIVSVARKLLKSQGRDFNAEFEKWKEANHG
jgi:hypothetical protein